jgi:hypothetical protein
MKDGFLYVIVKNLIYILNRLSIVEHLKDLALYLNKEKNDSLKVDIYRNFAIDSFIVLKWIFLLVLIFFKISNCVVIIIVWYLIFTNILTYFYHHLWSDNALNQEGIKKDRVRRRFMNLMFAIAFSEFAFAYLFRFPYSSNFNWGDNGASFIKSIQFSFSNSLAANYSVVSPFNDIGNIISNIQLLLTFFFLTIILSRSIPQTNSND